MNLAQDKKPYRVRHELKFRQIEVQQLKQLTPSLLQIVLGGDDLADFVSSSFDDHVKLFIPDAKTGELIIPTLSDNGLKFPDGAAPVMRDYTPRAYDNAAKTITLEFAIHEAGPATHWALNAKVGDKIAIAGPRGSMVIPDSYQHHLLFGDETALPAIARRLAELPSTAQALVFVEVDSTADQLIWQTQAQVTTHWLHRHGQSAASIDFFDQALAQLQLPPDDYYIWIAAELKVARHLRKRLVNEFAVDKAFIKAASYWQKGTQNSGQTLPDDED